VGGHIGLPPQTFTQISGFKVQEKDLERAKKLIESDKDLEEAGEVIYTIVEEQLGCHQSWAAIKSSFLMCSCSRSDPTSSDERLRQWWFHKKARASSQEILL
jgi:hypothetical protein